jgi:hypothetical protein
MYNERSDLLLLFQQTIDFLELVLKFNNNNYTADLNNFVKIII